MSEPFPGDINMIGFTYPMHTGNGTGLSPRRMGQKSVTETNSLTDGQNRCERRTQGLPLPFQSSGKQ